MILALGGTHGDFLLNCCRLMADGLSPRAIEQNGRAESPSTFKHQRFYIKGKKIDLRYDPSNVPTVEMGHTWYEDYLHWDSRFFYIQYEDYMIPIIRKMWLEKCWNSNLKLAINDLSKALPDELSKKINKKNFNEVFFVMYKSALSKCKKQPNITRIKMTELYHYDSLTKVLDRMGIFKKKYEKTLKEYYMEWRSKNIMYIEEIIRLGYQ